MRYTAESRVFVEVKRKAIDNGLRERIINRDKGMCRCCGTTNAPFHIDHVYPVSKGGETSSDNLVTSCVTCNLKKHDSIGMWPKPIGYFQKSNKPLSLIYLVILVLGIGVFMSGYMLSLNDNLGFYILNRILMLLGLSTILTSCGKMLSEAL